MQLDNGSASRFCLIRRKPVDRTLGKSISKAPLYRTPSNGGSGVRYAYVQFDAEKDIDWFVDAFCRKKYGATLYRLREDIIYAQ